LDEDLRGILWPYLVRHNARGIDAIDIVRVGDLPDLPLGSADPDILIWCERNDRILVSHDKGTAPGHLRAHLGSGRHSPGLFLVRDIAIAQIVSFLVLVAHATGPEEWRDAHVFIP
jgi:hypothetical protein